MPARMASGGVHLQETLMNLHLLTIQPGKVFLTAIFKPSGTAAA
jgi:hypothetical protein